jgi:predicted transcriptional regulator
MREATKQYVGRKKAQANFQAEARDAWKSYLERGLHLTGKEVRDWLGGWGTENGTKVPACHE